MLKIIFGQLYWVPLLLEGTLETNLVILWKSCLLIENNRDVSTTGNRQLFSSGHLMNDEKAVGLVKTEKGSHLYLLIRDLSILTKHVRK